MQVMVYFQSHSHGNYNAVCNMCSYVCVCLSPSLSNTATLLKVSDGRCLFSPQGPLQSFGEGKLAYIQLAYYSY